MINMKLLDMVRNYQALLETKEAMAAKTKENNAAIEAVKAQIAQQMVDDDCPSIATGGYRFTLQEKTIYSKRSEEVLAAEGVNFLDILREEGLGDIIVERVDSRTLQATMKGYVEEHGELSEELSKVITVYETYDIGRRRETAKKGGGKK